MLIAAIYAVACIRYKADQVVSGAAINILMLGIPGFLSGAFFLSSGSTPQIPKEHLIPWHTNIDRNCVRTRMRPAGTFCINTPFGLRLRAVGENPEAADAAGCQRQAHEVLGGVVAGVLAGIGGAYLSIGQSSLFTRNMTSGRGFIALAALDLRKVETISNTAGLSVVWFH